jgi:hypothetical protein
LAHFCISIQLLAKLSAVPIEPSAAKNLSQPLP